MTDYRLLSVAGEQVQSSGRLITSSNQLLSHSDMINGGFQSGRQGEMSIAEYDKTLKHAEMLCGGDELQLNCSESAKWENTPSHDRNIKKP